MAIKVAISNRLIYQKKMQTGEVRGKVSLEEKLHFLENPTTIRAIVKMVRKNPYLRSFLLIVIYKNQGIFTLPRSLPYR